MTHCHGEQRICSQLTNKCAVRTSEMIACQYISFSKCDDCTAKRDQNLDLYPIDVFNYTPNFLEVVGICVCVCVAIRSFTHFRLGFDTFC